MRFAWDERKASLNLGKHGVSFEEATTVFADPLAMIVEDPGHPERAWIIGESAIRHILLVVYRETDAVRIISARRATRHERRAYEEGV